MVRGNIQQNQPLLLKASLSLPWGYHFHVDDHFYLFLNKTFQIALLPLSFFSLSFVQFLAETLYKVSKGFFYVGESRSLWWNKRCSLVCMVKSLFRFDSYPWRARTASDISISCCSALAFQLTNSFNVSWRKNKYMMILLRNGLLKIMWSTSKKNKRKKYQEMQCVAVEWSESYEMMRRW